MNCETGAPLVMSVSLMVGHCFGAPLASAEVGDRRKRAVELLAQADLDLRGARDLDPDVVMDVLVARLSKLRR